MILIDNFILLSKYLINKIYPLKDNIKYIGFKNKNYNHNIIYNSIDNFINFMNVPLEILKGRV